MPTVIEHPRILLLQAFFDDINLIFNLITVYHGKLFVMVMGMTAFLFHLLMMMYHRGLLIGILMMYYCMHQDIQSPFFPGTDRNHRNTKHLRQAMHINFHSPLFHNIHHIQCKHHRFSQFDQLQR